MIIRNAHPLQMLHQTTLQVSTARRFDGSIDKTLAKLEIVSIIDGSITPIDKGQTYFTTSHAMEEKFLRTNACHETACNKSSCSWRSVISDEGRQ